MNNQCTAMHIQRKRRRSAAVLVSIAIVASLCLQGLMTPSKLSNSMNDNDVNMDSYFLDSHSNGGDSSSVNSNDDYDDALLPEDSQLRRSLRSSAPEHFHEGYYIMEEDYDDAASLADAADSLNDSTLDEQAAASPLPLQPYTLQDTLSESKIFDSHFCILIYDPPTDKFVGMYSKDHKWKNGNKKLWKAMRQLVYMLRRTFPERFTSSSPEFVLAMGSGDYPHVRSSKLPYTEGVAPMLMFGSAFRDPDIFPNMMAMPMPHSHHLSCFVEWVQLGRVCKELRASSRSVGEKGTMVFGEEYGLEWDGLIPQLIWRGTDFGYLPTLQSRPSLVHPDSRKFVPPKGNKRVAAITALNGKYDTLLPRWKGIALSADAELQVRGNELPWANMKFSSYLDKGKSSTVGSAKYAAWESLGIATGKGMPLSDLAGYRYHIDLGGGGGTTWGGTIEKLAMPGLLFHHVTPTKDYIHDRLTPWKHYVPVSPDLKDLKQKFDWAESHPQQAKRIADTGTEFMRDLGTEEGFGRMFQEDFVEPLRRVIEAYQPVSSVHPDMTSWKELLQSMGEDCRIMPVMECRGISPDHRSCGSVGGDDVKEFQRSGSYKG
mmetsp:Transcript_26906/g.57694  ORF Transcript_26906/g.57694 Transcript_26906/m.57694 type:complete len:601 (-) Transcript_26906:68-1870(-)